MREGDDENGDGHVLRFGGKASDVLPDEKTAKEEAGGSPRWLLFHQSDQSLYWFVVIWVVRVLLERSYAYLSAMRDEPGTRSRRLASAIRRVRRTQNHLRASSDMQAIAAEIPTGPLDWANPWDGSDFEFKDPEHPQRNRASWIDDAVSEAKQHAKVLRTNERRIRERLTMESTLVAAVANLRLQRAVFWLSALVLGLGAAGLVVAILGLSQGN
ncbi:MAG TPA: hypothetical protein VF081_07280 [Solirubrobacterales bacterium]